MLSKNIVVHLFLPAFLLSPAVLFAVDPNIIAEYTNCFGLFYLRKCFGIVFEIK